MTTTPLEKKALTITVRAMKSKGIMRTKMDAADDGWPKGKEEMTPFERLTPPGPQWPCPYCQKPRVVELNCLCFLGHALMHFGWEAGAEEDDCRVCGDTAGERRNACSVLAPRCTCWCHVLAEDEDPSDLEEE